MKLHINNRGCRDEGIQGGDYIVECPFNEEDASDYFKDEILALYKQFSDFENLYALYDFELKELSIKGEL